MGTVTCGVSMKRTGDGSRLFSVRSAPSRSTFGSLLWPKARYFEFTRVLLGIVLLTFGPLQSSVPASGAGLSHPNSRREIGTFIDDGVQGQTSSRNRYATVVEMYAPQVQSLLRRMTLEEKVGQMTQLDIRTITDGTGSSARINPAKLDLVIRQHAIGSIFNAPGGEALTGEKWHDIIHTIQRKAAETRLAIPVMYGIDSIHGATYILGSTLFPHNIGMAATWNPELVFRAAEVTAEETRSAGIPWVFSPNFDIGRTPTWPRTYETYGEDPLLAATLGVNAIRGYQGDDLRREDKVAACLKHFAGYGMSYNGKDRSPAWLPEIELRDYSLNLFARGIEAGAASVMTNSAVVNGVPGVIDRRLLGDVLREEMKFRGVVVSDFGDVQNLVNRYKVAVDNEDAVRQAVTAGMDMSMVPVDFSFYDALLKLARNGSVSTERIDEAVGRILTLKFALGLFDQPEPQPKALSAIGKPESKNLSLEAAEQSITLLKNERNLLPLRPGTRLLVTGPTAGSLTALHGGWSYTWQGNNNRLFDKEAQTIVSALQQQTSVTYVASSGMNDTAALPTELRAATHDAEAIVVCVGEEAYAELPGTIVDLTLPGPQLRLVEALVNTGKPVILVLVEGRPRLISRVAGRTKAIVLTYLPGPCGAKALANILFGVVNPSGRLPFTYPRDPNLLMPYDHHEWEAEDTAEGFGGFRPQFEFGYGLSYTSFAYSHLRAVPVEFGGDQHVDVEVDVQNTGKRPGQEVVQLYATPRVAAIAVPVKRLRAFQKVALQPGEIRTIRFRLSVSDFTIVGSEGHTVFAAGEWLLDVATEKTTFVLR
jgi:beta-glucosidase